MEIIFEFGLTESSLLKRRSPGHENDARDPWSHLKNPLQLFGSGKMMTRSSSVWTDGQRGSSSARVIESVSKTHRAIIHFDILMF